MPRWPAAVALLVIGASYIALSENVTVGPRTWLPGLMTVLVVPLMSAHARGHYRLARRISFVLIVVVTISVALSVFLLVTTLPGREDFLFPQMAQQDGKEATGWSAGFLDYLFLAFNTSTAFSPTDTAVLSQRAKVLTMVSRYCRW